MPENNCQKKKITLMLLQEDIWKLEDKLNVIMEGLADHEADLIRHNSRLIAIVQRLDNIESQIKPTSAKHAKKH